MDSPFTALDVASYALLFTLLKTTTFWKFLFGVVTFSCRFLITYALLVLALPEIILFFRRMEPKAVELLAVLTNNNLSIDAKVTHLLGLKSDIKQKNVPDGAVPPIFECLRLAIASPHSALIAAGFSTLGHFLKRLFIQGQQDLVSQHADILYPHLLERLGDHKERLRAQSAQAFTELWPAANAAVESNVLGVALKGKNPRAKQAALLWLSHVSLL